MPDFNQLLAEDSKSASSSNRTTGPSADALFAEINKGSDITKGLKQVSDAQKTHKNPAIRGTNTIPGGTLSSTSTSVRTQQPVQKPPVLELVDKKWKVEYQLNKHDLVIDQTDLKHTVYIYQCKECTIQVKGKVNSILIDSCTRVALLFDDVLSTIEFINSKNVQMQVLGRVPTVIIEKTDGCQVYLSKQSLETEIVSSKSSAMNVLTPNQSGDEYTEHPIPEQYKTVIDPKSGKLVTGPTEIA
jgi:adenylyl cyclase-associated protein